MKKYTSPKIKSVALDPEQAILEVCRVGGAYMYTNTPNNYCMPYTGGGIFGNCPIAVRGVSKKYPSVGAESSGAAS